MESAISYVNEHADGYLVANDQGRVEFFDNDQGWAINGNEVVGLSIGFEVDNKSTCWIARWNGALVNLLSIQWPMVGKSHTHEYRIHDIGFNGERIAVGCENSQVFVWEKDFSRSWNSQNGNKRCVTKCHV